MASSLVQLTNQIRQKSRSIARCCKEFDLYIVELEKDKKTFAELKVRARGGRDCGQAKGETTSQAENVVKETEAMIPIVRKNAIKMADSFLDFWESNCDALNAAITGTDPEKHKLAAECGRTARLLDKITSRTDDQEAALDPAILAMLRAVQADMEVLAAEKPLTT